MERLIHIFRTNVADEAQRETLRGVLDLEEVIEWSVDLEDIDKVLRVVCTAGDADIYKQKVKVQGFICEELE